MFCAACRYGKRLAATCQSYRNADREVRETSLQIEGVWLKTEHQVHRLGEIWNALPEAVQDHQHHVLELLQERLCTAVARLEELGPKDTSINDSSIRSAIRARIDSPTLIKLKYAAYLKSRLQETLADLESWHRRFDPSWYLLIRLPTKDDGPRVAQAQSQVSVKELEIIERLKSVHQANRESGDIKGPDGSVFCPPGHTLSRRTPISHSDAELAMYRDQVFIVDARQTPQSGKPDSRAALTQGVLRDTRDIVRILKNVDSETFGLLSCKWAMKITDEKQSLTSVRLLFTIPDGCFGGARSLRRALLDGQLEKSIDARFRLAKLLARSVSFLHSAGIVHKNMRPETVLLLMPDPGSAPDTIGTPFLVGFERFRHADDHTYMMEDGDWKKDLYRHPRRQGEYPEERYRMQHDIYSLGVCLLEIGLGVSFVHFSGEYAVPAPSLSIADHLENKDRKVRAFDIKRVLEKAAETLLPGCMGTVYTRLVLSCLTCLDPGNQYFGGEENFQDQDGILIAVRYIEKVRPLLMAS